MPEPVIVIHGGLTPFFLASRKRQGKVHSSFEHVINLSFPSPSGPLRILTITGESRTGLPDSLQVADDVLAGLRRLPLGTPVLWEDCQLTLGGITLRCDPEKSALQPWRPPRITPEKAGRFLDIYRQLRRENGFASLPAARQARAMVGLRDFAEATQTGHGGEKNWPIGLGRGTTPAGDDAVVGELCVFGTDFELVGPGLLEKTTDISAKYLRCAQEGYFSLPLRSAWESPSAQTLEAVAAIGATSGMDMLLGMAIACEWYLKKEEDSMIVKDEIARRKLIAIVRGLPAEQLEGLAEALLKGGIGLMEITFNQARPETWKQTAEGIAMLSKKFEGRIIPGAGTVITQEQLTMAYEAGAKYIISPNVDVDIIRRTKELGLVSLPGAFSPTEAVTAWNAGADFVKIFPVGNLGPAYIKALKAPLAHIPMMAVGGVNEANADDFMRAGCSGLGIGGNLVNKEWIAAGEWDKISDLAALYVKAVS